MVFSVVWFLTKYFMGQSDICFRYQVCIKQHDGPLQEAGNSKGAWARGIKAATDIAAFEKKGESHLMIGRHEGFFIIMFFFN
ncbi:unnamed protein product, partial [Ixodes pacificus]